MSKEFPVAKSFIGGKFAEGESLRDVVDPYRGEMVG